MKAQMLYFFTQSLNSILKNRLVHIVGVSTMVVSLLIFGAFLLLFVNLSNWVQDMGRSTSMSVYLKEDISEGARERIAAYIRELPSAEINRLISKEEAMKEFRRALGAQAGLLDGLSINPLPASFEVVFKDVSGQRIHLQRAKQGIEVLEGVEDVQYSEAWLDRFERLMNMIRLIGLVIGGLLCIGVLFIITNTIKLTIFSRKDEIEILKLVGATDWFVKAPFLLEGVMQGLLSGLVALGILFAAYALVSAKKLHFLGLAALEFSFLPWEYILSLLILSLGLGCIGSLIAVGRFFEV